MDAFHTGLAKAPKLHLCGKLAEICGAAPQLHFATIRQALGLLHLNYPELKRIQDMPVRICLNNFEVGPETFDLELPPTALIEIEPSVQGAGSGDGLGKLILGAALIATGAYLALPAPGAVEASALAPASVTSTLTYVGLTIALNGVGMMLSADTKTEDEQRGGGQYSGPQTNVGDGTVMPLLYGYARVGGVVIQTSIDAIQLEV